MSDLFSSYGETAAPRAPQRRQAKHKADLSPLEKRMQERQRLSKAYRIWRRNENRHVLASEPRLLDFMRYLRTVTAETGQELIDAIGASDWLRRAPQPVRIFALRMVAARADRINRGFGNEALDDPMPPDSSIYFAARDLLHAGGRA